MPNVSNVVRSIQDIMRKDAGTYVVQRSIDQKTWCDSSGEMLGTGDFMEWLTPAPARREFFRLRAK